MKREIYNYFTSLMVARKLIMAAIAAILLHSNLFAQFGLTQTQRDSLNRLLKIDHDNMREQLGITIPNRPGKSGTPGNPNFANTEESKVTPYTLPDPLVLKNGKKVETAQDWWEKRRPEIKEDFDRELYGRVPANVPSVTWKVIGIKDTLNGNYPIIEKTLLGIADNSSYPAIKVEIELVLTVPKNATAAVPVVTHFGAYRSTSEPMTTIGSVAEPGWKHQLLQRGWGYAELNPASIQADNAAGLRSGIIGLVNKGAFRKPDDWGALRAWAWGVSRAIDYYETDPSVDTKRLAIEGLSRYGKAAATTMMYETRLSLAFIGSAGAGGTKLYRRHLGQEIENLAGGEYYWFAGNIIKYGSILTVDDLPVDGHMLVALCAPRPIFISSGAPHIEGQWIDAKGMFLGGVYGGPVYKLLGKKDLGTTEFPPIGLALVSGDIAFRQHGGGHTTAPNWSTWIAWACKYWGPCSYP